MNNILKHLFHHLLLGLFVGFLSWKITASFWLGVLGMLVNIFIDLDHLIEYLVFSKRFNLREFLSGSHFEQKGKILVLFHAWEYVALAAILWILTSQWFFFVLGLAIGAHLVFDQFTWNLSPWAYFITYRIKNKFSIAKICKSYKK